MAEGKHIHGQFLGRQEPPPAQTRMCRKKTKKDKETNRWIRPRDYSKHDPSPPPPKMPVLLPGTMNTSPHMCLGPYVPKKVGMFGISGLGSHYTLRSHSSHSKPRHQCTKQWPLPWSCPLQTPPLRKPAKIRPCFRLLKTMPIGYLRPGSHICHVIPLPPS